MSGDRQAQLLLLTYLAVAVGVVAIQAWRCPNGPLSWLLYAVNRLYVGLGFRLRTNRRCPFPLSQPAIVIANHRSPVDPMLLWHNNHLRSERAEPRVINFMMASEYFSVRGISLICRAMQSIPVNRNGRDMKAIRETLRRMESGRLIGIFPEGGINEGTELMPANEGVSWLALRAKVPVYPVYIHNSPQGPNMVACFYTFQRVRIYYGAPIDLIQYDRGARADKLAGVTERLMDEIVQLRREAEEFEERVETGIVG